MDKRTFIKTSLVLGAGALVSGRAFSSVNSASLENEFEQTPLGYEFNALEPYIDAQTMELHYTKHHAGYTAKFNTAVQAEGLSEKGIKAIFNNVSKYSTSIRNNGGGYYNHELYWKVMNPNGGGIPSGSLMKEIEKTFGSFEEFKSQYSKAAATVFGSGWAWLINQDGKLKITQTPNQDNPLMDVTKEKGYPLLPIDVWEHAYYLKYQNMRTSYIEAFMNVVDWNYVAKRFEKSNS